MRTTFTKTALTLCAVYVVVFGGEAALEWWHAGSPGLSATSWVDVNNAKLVDILSPMARGYNNALAMLIATAKAATVALVFMHLYYDHKFHGVIFVSSLVFLGIFIAFTMFDTETRGRAEAMEGEHPANIKDPFGGTASEAAAKAKLKPAAAPAHH